MLPTSNKAGVEQPPQLWQVLRLRFDFCRVRLRCNRAFMVAIAKRLPRAGDLKCHHTIGIQHCQTVTRPDSTCMASRRTVAVLMCALFARSEEELSQRQAEARKWVNNYLVRGRQPTAKQLLRMVQQLLDA